MSDMTEEEMDTLLEEEINELEKELNAVLTTSVEEKEIDKLLDSRINNIETILKDTWSTKENRDILNEFLEFLKSDIETVGELTEREASLYEEMQEFVDAIDDMTTDEMKRIMWEAHKKHPENNLLVGLSGFLYGYKRTEIRGADVDD